MDNNEWLERFLTDCEFRSCSAKTLEAYRQRINVFLEYIGDIPVRDLKRQDCTDFLAEMCEKVSKSSVCSYITALKSFGRFIEAELWDEGWRNVFGTLRYPKTEEYKPILVSEDEIERMLEAMPKRTPTAKRDYALACLAYSSGLRASELADLTVEDIDTDERTVHVRHGKGDKERWSFMDTRAQEAVLSWLHARRKFDGATSDRLFVGRGSERLSRMSIYTVISDAGSRVGMTVTPHTMRRSRTTHLRESGTPLDVLQKMLGHSSPTTTSDSYVKFSPESIRDMVEGRGK